MYAVGDIVGKGAFTHTSMYQSIVVVRTICSARTVPRPTSDAVPRVTFTDPEVGVGRAHRGSRPASRVGTSGPAYVELSPSHPAAGSTTSGNDGLVKLVADGDRLVGATSVGPIGGEVLSMLTLAVHAQVPLGTLRSMIYAYPTFHRAVQDAVGRLG